MLLCRYYTEYPDKDLTCYADARNADAQQVDPCKIKLKYKRLQKYAGRYLKEYKQIEVSNN